MEKEFGLVLAGGGMRGAYQVGVWKALKEMNIKVKAVVGASIGAINGALMVQDDLEKMEELYNNIKLENIMNLNRKINTEKNIFDIVNIVNIAADFTEQKGIDNTPLREVIDKYIDEEKVYNSEIDFGLITYSVQNKKSLELFKSQIPKEKLKDYLMASSCFPIFKPQAINGEEYYDGGFYDNVPINMLIEQGYENIIVADIYGPGLSKKMLPNDAYVKIISPRENLGGMFEFNREKIQTNIKLGYLDTLKSFNKLQGHIYYFRAEEFSKMLEIFNLQTIYGLEYAAEIYKMDKYKIYTFEEFINELNQKHLEAEKLYNEIKDSNFKKIFGFKDANKLFDKGLGLCLVKDFYLERPVAKISNYMRHYVKDYLYAIKALIEIQEYLN